MRRPQVISRIKEEMSRFPDTTTILYGSEARGDARPDSDFDLLIIVDRPRLSQKERLDIMTPLVDLEFEMGVDISSMILSSNEWNNRPFRTPFQINVQREDIKI